MYLAKCQCSLSVSEIEFEDNVTDTIYVRSGLFPTELQLCAKANASGEEANIKS